MFKRLLGVSLATMALVGGLVGSASAAYPSKSVTLVVPFNAGGGTDTIARGFAEQLSKELGENVLVKNIAGAAGTMGTAQVASARPDGYTLGFIPIGPLTTQPHLRKLPYGVDSWEYISNVTLSPLTLLVDKNSPWNTLEDAVNAAKAEPGKYVYGSSGPGTMPHIAMVATANALDIELRHIPDKGSAPAMKSMAGGFIQFFSDTPVFLGRYDVKSLGVYSNERIADYPEVPTMKENGVDLEFSVWRGIVAPKNTPKEVIDKVAAATEKIASSAEFKEFIAKSKGGVKYMDSTDFEDFVRTEFAKNGDILKAAGLVK